MPSQLLVPILDDMIALGRANTAGRGRGSACMSMEDDEALVVGGLADNGPADKAGVRTGDRILAVNGTEVPDLAGCGARCGPRAPPGRRCRSAWARQPAASVTIASTDRTSILKAPSLH